MAKRTQLLVLAFLSIFCTTGFVNAQVEPLTQRERPEKTTRFGEVDPNSGEILNASPELIANSKIPTPQTVDLAVTKPRLLIVEFTRPPLAKSKPVKGPQQAAQAQIKAEQDAFLAEFKKAIGAKRKAAVQREPKDVYRYERVLNGIALLVYPDEMTTFKTVARGQRVIRWSEAVPVSAQLHQSVRQIRADKVHQALGMTGAGIVVAVIDTGVDYNHEALGQGIGPEFKVIGGYDFVNSDDDPLDDHGHGTHVTGIVAGRSRRVTGVAPDARVLAYKVLGARGNGDSATVIAAIERAIDPNQDLDFSDRAHVINLSLGGWGEPNDPMSRAISNATVQGVVCIAAAGNNGHEEGILSPGTARDAITVGSVNADGSLSSFSSRGPTLPDSHIKPDVLAPGGAIRSTWPGGSLRTIGGTSMACPHVAGIVALMLQKEPTLAPNQVRSKLHNSAKPIVGLDVMSQGTGVVDAWDALNADTDVHSPLVNFGLMDRATGVWQPTSHVGISNLSTTKKTWAINVDAASLPSGVSVAVDPATVEIPPQTSVLVDVKLTVTASQLPLRKATPDVHHGRLIAKSGSITRDITFAFNAEFSDPFEPNDTWETATKIAMSGTRQMFGGPARTQISQSGSGVADNDWFVFDAERGDSLYVYVDGPLINSPLSPRLELWADPAVDTRPVYSSGHESDMDPAITRYVLNRTGTWYLKVKAFEDNSIGPYRLYGHLWPKGSSYWIANLSNPVNFTRLMQAGGSTRFVTSQMNHVISQVTPPALPWQRPLRLAADDFNLTGAHGILGAEITVTIGGGNSAPRAHRTSFRGRVNGSGPAIETSRDSSVSALANVMESNRKHWHRPAGGAWNEVAVTGAIPDSREYAKLIFDNKNNRFLLFGGVGDTIGYASDLWAFDGKTWTQLEEDKYANGHPRPRRHTAIGFDPKRGVVVLFGGVADQMGAWKQDAWEWSPATKFKQLKNPPNAKGRDGHLAWDAKQQEMVLLQGQQLWTLDAATGSWTELSQRAPKVASWTHPGFVYHVDRDEFIMLVNSSANQNLWETWTWKRGSEWKKHASSLTGMPMTHSARLLYAPNAKRVLLVAPSNGKNDATNPPRTNIHEWDGTTWKMLEESKGPVRRYWPAAAIDPRDDSLFLFSGTVPSKVRGSRIDIRHHPSPAIVEQIEFLHTDFLSGMAISNDGNTIVTTTPTQMQIRDKRGVVLKTHPLSGPSEIVQLTGDAKFATLIEMIYDEVARRFIKHDLVFDLSTGKERFRVQQENSLRISGDARRLVQVSRLRLYSSVWDATSNCYVSDWRYASDPDEHIRLAHISADGSTVYAVSGRRPHAQYRTGITVHVLDAASGKRLSAQHFPEYERLGLANAISGLQVRADGKLAIVGSWGRDKRNAEAMIIHRDQGRPVAVMSPRGSVRDVDIHGNYALAGTKGVHSMIGKGGGEMYAIDLAKISAANQPPLIDDTQVTPRFVQPGGRVNVTCRVSDADGVCCVNAVLRKADGSVAGRIPMFDFGMHGDAAKGDGIYGGYWSSLAQQQADYSVDILATDCAANAVSISDAAEFTSVPSPWVTTTRVTLGSASDPNAVVFGLSLKNEGKLDAANLRIQITSNHPGIDRATDSRSNETNIALIEAGTTVDTWATQFSLMLSPKVVSGTTIPIRVVIVDGTGERWTQSLNLKTP